MPMEKTVLVVEDEANIVTILTINLERKATASSPPMTDRPGWSWPGGKNRTSFSWI